MVISWWRRDRPGAITLGDRVPLLRAGGGVPNAVVAGRQAFAKNQIELAPVALKPWGAWYGSEASNHMRQAIESNIGGIVAHSTRRNYEGHFKKWETFRGVNGLSPYLDM